MAQSQLWTALHYVEANPVPAALVKQPIDYEWSTAEAHLSGHDRRRLLDMEFFRRTGGVNNWRLLFGHTLSDSDCRALRRATHAGQPLGDEEFRHNPQLQHERRKAPTSAPVAAPLANEQVFAAS